MAGVYHKADATVAASRAAAVTASDVTVFPTTRSIYVGTGGNIKVRMAGDGALVTFNSVAAGIFPVQVDMVYSTGTTASNIIALY